MSWGAVIGAGVGLVGSAMSSDGGETSTATKEPWGPAQDWMRANITSGQQLQNHYSQNPFNEIQQQGMQGMLDNYDYQNKTVIPGLMGFSNGLMNSNYQRAPSRGTGGGELQGLLSSNNMRGQSPPGLMSARQPAGQPGEMYSRGPAQAPMPMQQPQPQQQMPQGQPQGQPMQQGPFGMPASQAGAQPIDWQAMNPLYKAPEEAPKPYVPTDQEVFRQNFGDAMFPEEENKQQFGANGPSLEEQYWRNKLGRPSKYINIEG